MSSPLHPQQHLVGRQIQNSNMAVAQSTPKSKAASSKQTSVSNNNAAATTITSPANASATAAAKGAKVQMHRRSRTGCYTCRLRRKKCDEGSPSCSACKNLGLKCEYKRPMWWSNNDQRRLQKDNIKTIIKRKKLTEKTMQVMTPGSETPPGLSHSVPTSATFTDSIDRTRSASVDSGFGLDFDFNATTGIADYTAYNAQMHSSHSQYVPVYPEYAPYEVDVKTERQMYINDSLTRRESTISTFSTYPQPQETLLQPYPNESEWSDTVYPDQTPDQLDISFFDFASTRPTAIPLDAKDQSLYDLFITSILPTLFPIYEAHNPNGASAAMDFILPALETNKCYLHNCLSIAAQYLKASSGIAATASSPLDADIMRHRYSTISELCTALNADESHSQILDATLAIIFFQSLVSRIDDSLPDIPWHQHFQAAVSLVQKLDLLRAATTPGAELNMNMTLTAWIDILGSTFIGHAPTFAHLYREKHLSAPTATSLGLRNLMGCDDKVLYLISEIACLEALKIEGMEDMSICQHVHSLGDQISLTETGEAGPKIPFDSATGVLLPGQLSKNITHCFRLAARIYLCSLVPGFEPKQASCLTLVSKLAAALEFVPGGPAGFDRCLVWVYLIGGSVATEGSAFRELVEERSRAMGVGSGIEELAGPVEAGSLGSWSRLKTVLEAVWERQDKSAEYVSWKMVMAERGWDFLLI